MMLTTAALVPPLRCKVSVNKQLENQNFRKLDFLKIFLWFLWAEVLGERRRENRGREIIIIIFLFQRAKLSWRPRDPRNRQLLFGGLAYPVY